MQERVLGAIIIGGVAIVGVIWAMCEGIPQVVKAKNQESKLESLLVERVNAKVEGDQKVTSLDVKRISYEIKTVMTLDKWGDPREEKLPVIAMEGYNNKNEQFKIVYYGKNSNINDCNNKLKSSGTAYEQLRYDIYQNYTMTTSDLLYSIVNDSSCVFESYSVLDGYYGRMETPSGQTNITKIEDEATYVKQEDTYTSSDTEITSVWNTLEYGETTTEYYNVVGKVTKVERIQDTSGNYSLVYRLETKDVTNTSLQFEVYNTKFDSDVDQTYKNIISKTAADGAENVLLGKMITSRGTLTKAANYKVIYELDTND